MTTTASSAAATSTAVFLTIGPTGSYCICCSPPILAPSTCATCGMMRADIVFDAWREAGLLPHQILIWRKSRPVLTRCDFMWDYEPCLYGWVKGNHPSATMRPPANAAAVWEVESGIEDGAAGIHPTMKPVELIRRPIEYHTKPGQIIYEPFSGSGTAIIAAENTRRACYAIQALLLPGLGQQRG